MLVVSWMILLCLSLIKWLRGYRRRGFDVCSEAGLVHGQRVVM